MKWFKYIILFTIVILSSIIFLFFVLIEKEDISKYIHNETGTKIFFDTYGISFYPAISLKLSNVKYEDGKNTKIYSQKLLINFSFDSIDSIINPRVKALYLVQPDITIYKSKNKNASQDNKIIDIKNLYIKDAKISYESYKINNINLSASLEKSILNIKNLTIKKWKGINNIDISGSIDLNKVNPYFDLSLFFKKSELQTIAKKFDIKFPDIKDKKSLKDISLSTKIKGDISKLYINETRIDFDNTSILASAIIKDLNLESMVSVLDITQFDLNKYVDLSEDNNNPESKKSTDINSYIKLLGSIKHLSSIKIKKLHAKDFIIEDIFLKVKIKDGFIDINPMTFKLYEGELKGIYQIDTREEQPKFRVKQQIKGLELSKLFDKKDKTVEGVANLLANVTFEGTNQEDITKSISGLKMLSGKDITFHKYDIDKILSQYEKTQKIDLIDIGAMLVAGPFAGLLTQSVKFAVLKNKVDKTGSTKIKEFSSIWKIKNSKAIAKDVAIKTQNHIIALKGEINLSTQEFIDIKIAVLDKKGCAKYMQTLSGNLMTNEIKNKENVIETFLSPITTIVNSANKLFGGCQKFYKGKIKW